MIIQPQYNKKSTFQYNPDVEGYEPRIREGVIVELREDMITAIVPDFYYPGSPKGSKYNNLDPYNPVPISMFRKDTKSDPWRNTDDRALMNTGDITETTVAITPYNHTTGGYQYFQNQNEIRIARRAVDGGGHSGGGGINYQVYELYPFYDMPYLFNGGKSQTQPDGKINHARSYTGTGIGLPRAYGAVKSEYDGKNENIFVGQDIIIVEDPVFGEINVHSMEEQTTNYRTKWDPINGRSGEILGPSGKDAYENNLLDISAYTFNRWVYTNDNESLTEELIPKQKFDAANWWWRTYYNFGNSEGAYYDSFRQNALVELPTDSYPNTVIHYRISFDCASCLKITNPNCRIQTDAGSPLVGYDDTYKWLDKNEPSGVTAIYSIGQPTTAIILGSKEGTKHGRYLTKFDMAYGGVGPDCFNARAFQIEYINFEKYYPTRYSFRNDSYLNGNDGATMGSLYRGCTALKQVPDMIYSLIDYSGFFEDCYNIRKIGETGVSGKYLDAMLMDTFLRNCEQLEENITIDAPRLISFKNNLNLKKITGLKFTRSNFRHYSDPGLTSPREVFSINGATAMTVSKLITLLDSIYLHEIVGMGGRLDRLQFDLRQCGGSNSTDPLLANAANRLRDKGAIILLT